VGTAKRPYFASKYWRKDNRLERAARIFLPLLVVHLALLLVRMKRTQMMVAKKRMKLVTLEFIKGVPAVQLCADYFGLQTLIRFKLGTKGSSPDAFVSHYNLA
jgi:hypothetical protein